MLGALVIQPCQSAVVAVMLDGMFHVRGRLLFILLAVISLGVPPAFAAAPTFTAFSPTSGKLGVTVTLTGSNFAAPLTVTFNGVASTGVQVLSTTKATATVPATASTGKITVKTSGGSVTGGTAFAVLPGITVSSTVGRPNATQTFTYSGFGANEAVDFYLGTENFALGSSSASGAGTMAAAIPKDATPGVHWITAVGRHSGSSGQTTFRVRADWRQVSFNTRHQGGNPDENVLSSSTVASLQESWRTLAIGSMQSSPADVSGVVYTTFGDGSVRAFDEVTGTQKWSTATGGGTMFSSPTFYSGVVYVGSSDKYLYAFDANTGTQKWRFAVGDIVYSAPTVANGIVYFGSYDKKIYALNATTGSLLWSFATGAAVFASPLFANGVVYVGSFDNSVYALNATTGAQIWKTATTGLVLASPVLVGGLVCVGSEDKIMYALHASTGDVAWKYTTTGLIDSTAAVVGSTLFVGTVDGRVYSLSAGGAFRWAYTVPSGAALRGPLCTANELVYATDGSYTYVFAQSSGALLTTLPVGSPYGGPVVVNGAVLAGDNFDNVLTRYTLNAVQTGNFAAPRPEPARLRPRPLP